MANKEKRIKKVVSNVEIVDEKDVLSHSEGEESSSEVTTYSEVASRTKTLKKCKTKMNKKGKQFRRNLHRIIVDDCQEDDEISYKKMNESSVRSYNGGKPYKFKLCSQSIQRCWKNLNIMVLLR